MQLARQAYTLVEMLVALVVGAIVVMATYASYEMVNTQYQKNTDIANMHTSGRAIMQMIERDVRMAGFEYRHTSGANKGKKAFGSKITKPLDITDSGNKCCDEVKVIYDYFNEDDQTVKRIQIHYFTKEHNTPKKGNRYRLYKQVNDILPAAKTRPEEVLADFVEDLQIVNIFEESGLYSGDRGRDILIIDTKAKKEIGQITTRYNDNSALVFKTKKTGQESLVNIKLTLRSEKEYGSNNRKYSKDEKAEKHQIGNYDFEFNDKYKHDVFATTVLVRNLAL